MPERKLIINSHPKQKILDGSSGRRSSSRESVPSQKYNDDDYVCNKAFDDLTKSKRGRPAREGRFRQSLFNARERRAKIEGNELITPTSIDVNSTLMEVLMKTGQKNTVNAPSTTKED